MARAKLTALAVERAHRSGERVLLSDGDGLYLRKQAREGASWTLRYHFVGRAWAQTSDRSASVPQQIPAAEARSTPRARHHARGDRASAR